MFADWGRFKAMGCGPGIGLHVLPLVNVCSFDSVFGADDRTQFARFVGAAVYQYRRRRRGTESGRCGTGDSAVSLPNGRWRPGGRWVWSAELYRLRRRWIGRWFA